MFRFVEEPSAATGAAPGAGRAVYWVYNFKRGRYYPFVPRPEGGSGARDNAYELRASSP